LEENIEKRDQEATEYLDEGHGIILGTVTSFVTTVPTMVVHDEGEHDLRRTNPE